MELIFYLMFSGNRYLKLKVNFVRLKNIKKDNLKDDRN